MRAQLVSDKPSSQNLVYRFVSFMDSRANSDTSMNADSATSRADFFISPLIPAKIQTWRCTNPKIVSYIHIKRLDTLNLL